MSANRVVARRREDPRVITRHQKLRVVREPITGKVTYARSPTHVSGDRWWREKQANLVEGRRSKVERVRKPPVQQVTFDWTAFAAIEDKIKREQVGRRPEGMSRQVARQLARQAIKIARRNHLARGKGG